jgi:hypothetical protein
VGLLRFFSRLFEPREPLAGAPEKPRAKTYSASSGYVYQYYFEGRRRRSWQGEAAREYVFRVSADRRTAFAVSVLLLDDAVQQWEQRHEREITSSEKYAIAKMTLFHAFDEREDPAAMREAVVARAADVETILKMLDRE